MACLLLALVRFLYWLYVACLLFAWCWLWIMISGAWTGCICVLIALVFVCLWFPGWCWFNCLGCCVLVSVWLIGIVVMMMVVDSVYNVC